MAKNSNGKQYAYCGVVKIVPKDYGGKQPTTYSNQSKQGGQSSFKQTTSKTSCVEKKTGGYTRATNKQVKSTLETSKERSTGRVVYKEEYKATSTYKIGDKNGYTEYKVEKRIRNVNYGGIGSSNKGKNKYLK